MKSRTFSLENDPDKILNAFHDVTAVIIFLAFPIAHNTNSSQIAPRYSLIGQFVNSNTNFQVGSQ